MLKKRKIKKVKVFYKEGQIILKDGSFFHFKDCRKCFHDDYFIEIIDLYDNLIQIPYRKIKYIFYHANNQANKGSEKLA